MKVHPSTLLASKVMKPNCLYIIKAPQRLLMFLIINAGKCAFYQVVHHSFGWSPAQPASSKLAPSPLALQQSSALLLCATAHRRHSLCQACHQLIAQRTALPLASACACVNESGRAGAPSVPLEASRGRPTGRRGCAPTSIGALCGLRRAYRVDSFTWRWPEV